jgi:hypothetical protein
MKTILLFAILFAYALLVLAAVLATTGPRPLACCA